jgi:transposase-like protein
MAKNSKSAAVREHLAKNPDASAKDVAKQFGVTPNLVYFIKSKMGRKARNVKRAKAVAAGEAAGLSDPITLIRKIRELSVQAGGMKKLHELVGVLAE